MSPLHADQLVQDGWTAEHFALIAEDGVQFDAAILDFFPDKVAPLERAALKLAWQNCQTPASGASQKV